MSTKKQSPYDENPFAVTWRQILIICGKFHKAFLLQDNQEEEELNFNTPFVKPKDIQQPPWLQESTSTETPKPQSNSTDSTSTSSDPAVPRFILYTRVINLMLSISMIVVSLLSLLTTQTATTGVLSCYVVVFSCLLCCFETHLKQISKLIALNFGFMYSAKSRSVFMIFLGNQVSPLLWTFL